MAETPVMFGQRCAQLRAGHKSLARHWRRGAAQASRDAVDIEELRVAAPTRIRLSPIALRVEPDRKALGKILVGVLLGIPARQMPDEIAAERIGLVVIAIGPRVRPEQLVPFLGLVEPIGVIEGVAGLMAQIAEDFFLAFGLDPFHQLVFETAQAFIGEVKRNADDRNSFRATPLIGKVNGGLQRYSGLIELSIELLDQRLQPRALDL